MLNNGLISYLRIALNKKRVTHIVSHAVGMLLCLLFFFTLFDTVVFAEEIPDISKSITESVAIVNDGVGTDFIIKYGDFTEKVNSGVTFSWNGQKCHVSGTSSAAAVCSIINRKSSLPQGMYPGDKLFLQFDPSTKTVKMRCRIAFYSEEGEISDSIVLTNDSGPVLVPDNAVGLTVQIRVLSNSTVDYTIDCIELIKMPSQQMEKPLMVSFVDDDTTNVNYVRKYHDACCHNGIYGNYAAIAYCLGGGDEPTAAQIENRNCLLEYEQQGFGVLTHCFRQNSSAYNQWHNTNVEANESYCLEDLSKTMSLMREWGFQNYMHWVTPYGVSGSGIRRIAMELGVENLISYNNGRHNSLQDYDRYFIRRVALGENDTDADNANKQMEDVKSAIDACVAAGSGWLIITTHFNEWGGMEWSSELDNNGYPFGYARFNEVVQYSLNAGLQPVTIPEAWEYYEPVLDANYDAYIAAHTQAPAIVITEQPADFVGEMNKTFSMSVAANGDGLTYQWQYLSGSTWKNSSVKGSDTERISDTITEKRNGLQYRCVITDRNGCKVSSAAALLTGVTPSEQLRITAQPESVSAALDKIAKTQVAAEGEELTYQWYGRDPGQTKFWKSGVKSSAYSVRMVKEKSGREVYCVITDKYGNSVTSEIAVLTLANQK